MRQVNTSPPYVKHPAGKIVLILIVGGMIVFGGIQAWHEQSVFNHMSPAEHLREAEMAQEQRDSDASLSSYWPTTVRVDTDMDSFWLNAEERTCMTTSGAKGRVAAVTCNDFGSHQTHNIPVKFWGGVDRNVGSSWQCRREGDDFACRAID